MAQNSKIEWTDATWNPITGCSIVSPGCTNCYAMRHAGTRGKNHPSRKGLTKKVNGNHVWTGEVRLNKKWLAQPLHWRKPRMIFVCAHGDLFHEDVPDEWIDQVFAVIALCPQHTFQVLTKRPERMREYVSADRRDQMNAHAGTLVDWNDMDEHVGWPLPNVWLGTSIENQQTAGERIPRLLDTPAAIRFVSAEPLLGPVSLRWLCAFPENAPHTAQKKHGTTDHLDGLRRLDWVIVGGESGPKARPMHPDWARDLRDQYNAAEVPFFFKQWGSWKPLIDRDNDDPDWRANYQKVERGANYRILNLEGGTGFHGERVHLMRRVGKTSAGRRLDGAEHNAMPEVSK